MALALGLSSYSMEPCLSLVLLSAVGPMMQATVVFAQLAPADGRGRLGVVVIALGVSPWRAP